MCQKSVERKVDPVENCSVGTCMWHILRHNMENNVFICTMNVRKKGKAIQPKAHRAQGGWGSQNVLDDRHMKVVRLPALHTSCLYPQKISLVVIAVQGWIDPRAIIVAGKIKSMENSNDPIGNTTRNHTACSAVPKPTVLLHTSYNRNIPGKFGLSQYDLPYLCHTPLLAKAQPSHPPSKAILILLCST